MNNKNIYRNKNNKIQYNRHITRHIISRAIEIEKLL